MRLARDGFSVKAAKKKKRDLPPWYLDRPPEVPGAELFHEAYRDLCTERPPDGAIPWSKVRLYAEDKRLRRDVAAALWVVVRRMDAAERAWRVEDLEAGSGGG